MDKHVIVAPVGDNPDAIFQGLREFPTEKLILVSHESQGKQTERLLKDLQRFKVPTQVVKIKGVLWEELFKAISQIKRTEGKRILINVASGDRTMQCAASSAAFVNGVKAFSVEDGQAMLLPVLKFSYYKLLTEKKLELLTLLHAQPGDAGTIEMLAKRTGMSLPLISYHVNGSRKSEGLKEMGLIEAVEKKGRTEVKLSALGRLLVQGYVEQAAE